MVRLVNLLMRDEGEDTAIEEVQEVSKPASETLRSETVLVTSEGKEVTKEPEAAAAPIVVEEEDEDEMLIEV